MRAGVLGVLGSVAIMGSGLASGTGPALVALVPTGSSVEAGGYHLDLGEPDGSRTPRAWQGPIRITSAGKAACTVSEDVAIVERPLSMTRNHLLYVTTYSGSEVRVYVVDAATCAVKWTSPSFEGAATIAAGILTLPGHRPFKIGADGLPVAR